MLPFSQFIQERIYLQNVSPRTVDWYQQTDKWLSRFPLTEEGLKQFVMAMREAGLQAISCNNRIRCANAYLKWSGSPLRIAKLREEAKIPRTFSDEHLKRVFAFRPKSETDSRLHTLLLTLADTGMRIDEALGLKREDIDLDEMLLRIRGKGGKHRLVPFSFELRKALWRYTQKMHSSDLVFTTREGRRLGRRNVLRDFKLLCRSLGFEAVPRSIHALRHTFAVNYLRNGGSVFHLQKALGHSSLEMSRKYANLLTEDLQQVQHKVSLLQRLR
jgi:integrase/recombinase XerD